LLANGVRLARLLNFSMPTGISDMSGTQTENHLKKEFAMMQLADIRKNMGLVNAIDWEMTPEEAVRLYLEWGNNWAGGNYVIRSKNDVTHYFVVDTWESSPKVYLLRRNSEDCQELAKIELPKDMQERFLESVGHNRGVYALSSEIRTWLENQLQTGPHNYLQ
jgi:hypothetical protein